MTEATPSILLCTDKSGAWVDGLLGAAERAKTADARLLVYDIVAAHAMTSPRPNIWAGEGEAEVYDHPLDPVALEKLGRHDLAMQVQRAREVGADAWAWLPTKHTGAALLAYAAQERADLVLLPDDADPEVAADLASGNPGLRVETLTAV